MLTGIYLRGLMVGALLGAALVGVPLVDGVAQAVGAVSGVVLLAVALADVRQLVKEMAELHALATARSAGVVSTETRDADDVWGNEA